MSGIRILTVLDHYHPGWKAGGPIQAIRHLVAHLGDAASFDIVTSDWDLGDRRPYVGVPTGCWQEWGKARVLYLSRGRRSLAGWRALLRDSSDYDLVYLNSLFSRSTIRILTLRRLGLLPEVPYLLAPRGELQPAARSLKPHRKTAWLTVSRALRLYEGIEWQAATCNEQRDIRGALGKQVGPVHVAPDIPASLSGLSGLRVCDRLEGERFKRPGRARLVFISRICRMKNLDYALRVLSNVSGEIDFDIYGPIEDARYWRECQALTRRLPREVRVNYRGALSPDEVCRAFSEYDLFLFPTRGESYGHVVVESLLAGCPVLISDQTPWRCLAERKAGWDLPLDHPGEFAAAVSRVVAMDGPTLRIWSAGASRFAMGQGQLPDAVDANRRLFLTAALQSLPHRNNREVALT